MGTGKEGTIYLIDRDNMGRYNSVNNNEAIQTLPGALVGGWGLPAWWNNNVYFAGSDDGTTPDHLKAFAFNPVSELLSASPTFSVFHLLPFSRPHAYSFSKRYQQRYCLGAAERAVSKQRPDCTARLRCYGSFQGTVQLAAECHTGQSRPAVKFTVPVVVNGKNTSGLRHRLVSTGSFLYHPA